MTNVSGTYQKDFQRPLWVLSFACIQVLQSVTADYFLEIQQLPE